MIDQKALLAHIAAKAKQYDHKATIAAVLEGLATAIKRGDFDEEKEVE